MKEIYLGEKVSSKVSQRVVTIDKVPPKSCYNDSNRSNVVMNDLKVPTDDTLKRLYDSSARYFKR